MCAPAQLNPRYCEQLRALLSWPQSCGVLGGRPSSSLLFVGAQGGHVLFMDPHEVQEVRLGMLYSREITVITDCNWSSLECLL